MTGLDRLTPPPGNQSNLKKHVYDLIKKSVKKLHLCLRYLTRVAAPFSNVFSVTAYPSGNGKKENFAGVKGRH